MNPKIIVTSSLAVATLIAIGVWVNASDDNKAAAAAAGLDWDGKAFTVTATNADGTKVKTWTDISGGRMRVETQMPGSQTTHTTLNLNGEGWEWTTETTEVEGTSFQFITGCSRTDAAPSADDFVENPEDIDVSLEEGVFSVSGLTDGGGGPDLDKEYVGDAIQVPITDGSFSVMSFNDTEYALENVALGDHPAGTFDVPGACGEDGGDAENLDIYASYIDAYAKSENRRMLRELPEERHAEVNAFWEKTMSEHKTNLRTKDGRALWGLNEISAWAASVFSDVKKEFTINMRYHRYCGPDLEGCGKDMDAGVASCGGPVTEVDKCCAFHDWKCGQDQSDTGGTFGANRSSKKDGGSKCLFGVHSGRCEHCSCTGALAQCSIRALGSPCYAGGNCNAWWTAAKVNAVFGTIPCWHSGTCWSLRARWRRSCSCGWGCWCWWWLQFYWEPYSCTKTPMGRFAPWYPKTKCDNSVGQKVDQYNCNSS